MPFFFHGPRDISAARPNRKIEHLGYTIHSDVYRIDVDVTIRGSRAGSFPKRIRRGGRQNDPWSVLCQNRCSRNFLA